VATTCTEDGQNRLPKQARDGGTNFILRIKEQKTRLTLQEHDDDDDYDDDDDDDDKLYQLHIPIYTSIAIWWVVSEIL